MIPMCICTHTNVHIQSFTFSVFTRTRAHTHTKHKQKHTKIHTQHTIAKKQFYCTWVNSWLEYAENTWSDRKFSGKYWPKSWTGVSRMNISVHHGGVCCESAPKCLKNIASVCLEDTESKAPCKRAVMENATKNFSASDVCLLSSCVYANISIKKSAVPHIIMMCIFFFAYQRIGKRLFNMQFR